VLAVGITALQLLPFKEQLAMINQGYRRQAAASHLPLRALVTLGFPNAFGSPVDYNYFGALHFVRVGYAPAYYWEIQSFISVSALLLVVIAAARAKRMPRLAKGVLPYLWTGALIATVLIYVGGVPLGVVQHLLPFLKSNFIGRLRSVLGLLLAAMAAVGFQALLRESPGTGKGRAREASIWVLL